MRPPIPFAFHAGLPLAWHLGELQRLSGAGISVRLDLDALGPEEAVGCLNLMLHDPAMATPVEPFGSLLRALVERQSLTLWDLMPLDEGREAQFLGALPREHPECLACACFPICAGYAALAESCATWKTLIPRLAAAARELGRLGREQKALGNSEGFTGGERKGISPP